MEQKTLKEQPGKKQPADTAREGGAAYAPHSGSEKNPGSGEDRTSDKTLGEIAYAERHDDQAANQGGHTSPQNQK